MNEEPEGLKSFTKVENEYRSALREVPEWKRPSDLPE